MKKKDRALKRKKLASSLSFNDDEGYIFPSHEHIFSD
jgi:hypothetical protein